MIDRLAKRYIPVIKQARRRASAPATAFLATCLVLSCAWIKQAEVQAVYFDYEECRAMSNDSTESGDRFSPVDIDDEGLSDNNPFCALVEDDSSVIEEIFVVMRGMIIVGSHKVPVIKKAYADMFYAFGNQAQICLF